jgi:hypothetical protein
MHAALSDLSTAVVSPKPQGVPNVCGPVLAWLCVNFEQKKSHFYFPIVPISPYKEIYSCLEKYINWGNTSTLASA